MIQPRIRRRIPRPSRSNPVRPGESALRRALLRGWADRVARRAKADEAARLNAAADKDEDGGDGGGGRTKATRYRPAMLDLAVFLHPTSTLHRTSPDYVVYVDLLQTAKRPYLAGATAVEASWLVDDAPALAYLSSALEDPAPRYVAAKDLGGCVSPAALWEAPVGAPAVAERAGRG